MQRGVSGHGGFRAFHVASLYNQSKFLQAYVAGKRWVLARLAQKQKGLILAGRLAYQLNAPAR